MHTHIHRTFTRTCPDAHLCIHIETHKCTYTHTQRHTHTLPCMLRLTFTHICIYLLLHTHVIHTHFPDRVEVEIAPPQYLNSNIPGSTFQNSGIRFQF